jgi:hypothetical protein
MLAFNAVEVAIKEARIAFVAEEDEGVSQGLKEGLNLRLEGLVGLGIVVHY